jgi:hypothetical protein
MSTFLFEIISTTVVRVQKNGFGAFKPRHMTLSVSDDNILFQTNIDINYDFCISPLDTVIFQSQYVTGTPVEIADYLTSNIFNVSAGSVDGAAILSEENTFSESQSIIKNQVGATQLTIANATEGGSVYQGMDSASSGVYLSGSDDQKRSTVGMYAQAAFIEINAFGADSSEPNTINIAGSNHPLHIRLNDAIVLTILPTGIGDYADDAAAATGGVPVKGLYHTSGTLKIRVA